MGLKSYREANLSDLQGERFAILINLPEFDDSDDFMKTDIALRSVITACSSSYNLFKWHFKTKLTFIKLERIK